MLQSYTYNYIVESPTLNSVITTESYTGVTALSNTLMFPVPSDFAGNTLFANVLVTDSNGAFAGASSALITVSPALVIGPLAPSQTSMDQGQPATIYSSTSGGSPFPAYTYKWIAAMPNGESGLSPQVAAILCGASATSANCVFATNSGIPAGSYTFQLITSDAAGITLTTAPVTITVLNDPNVTISAPTNALDTGQSLIITANAFRGSGSYTYQWLSGTSASCTADASVGVTTATYSPVIWGTSPATYYCAEVTDGNGFSNYSATLPVLIDNGANTIAFSVSAGPASHWMDAGNSATFLGSVTSDNPGSFTYQWYNLSNGDSAIPGANTNSLILSSPAAATAGTYYYYLSAADGSVVANSPAVSLTVNNAIPSLGQAIFTNSNSEETVELYWNGGTSPYNANLYFSPSVMCSPLTTIPINSFTATSGTSYAFFQTIPAGPAGYFCHGSVSDTGTGVNSLAPTSLPAIFVTPQPAVSLSPLAAAIDAGQSVTFANSITTPGTPPYAAYYYSVVDSGSANALGNGEATEAGNTITFNAAGAYTVQETVIDSIGGIGTSNPVPVTVNSMLAITLIPSAAAIDAGQSVAFSNATTPGTPAYLYSYTTNSANAVINGNSITFPLVGTYDVVEYVQDSTGVNVPSENAIVTVNPLPSLSVTITPSTASINTGASVTFAATASGGTAPYTFNYIVNNTSGVTISGNSITFANAGAYNVIESATDSAGVTANSPIVKITVSTPPATTTIPARNSGNFGTGGLPLGAGLPPATTSTSTTTTIPVITPPALVPANSVNTTTTTIPSTTTVPTTTTIPTATKTKQNGNSNLWLIVGGVIVVILIVLGGIFYWLAGRKKKPKHVKKGGEHGAKGKTPPQ